MQGGISKNALRKQKRQGSQAPSQPSATQPSTSQPAQQNMDDLVMQHRIATVQNLRNSIDKLRNWQDDFEDNLLANSIEKFTKDSQAYIRQFTYLTKPTAWSPLKISDTIKQTLNVLCILNTYKNTIYKFYILFFHFEGMVNELIQALKDKNVDPLLMELRNLCEMVQDINGSHSPLRYWVIANENTKRGLISILSDPLQIENLNASFDNQQALPLKKFFTHYCQLISQRDPYISELIRYSQNTQTPRNEGISELFENLYDAVGNIYLVGFVLNNFSKEEEITPNLLLLLCKQIIITFQISYDLYIHQQGLDKQHLFDLFENVMLLSHILLTYSSKYDHFWAHSLLNPVADVDLQSDYLATLLKIHSLYLDFGEREFTKKAHCEIMKQVGFLKQRLSLNEKQNMLLQKAESTPTKLLKEKQYSKLFIAFYLNYTAARDECFNIEETTVIDKFEDIAKYFKREKLRAEVETENFAELIKYVALIRGGADQVYQITLGALDDALDAAISHYSTFSNPFAKHIAIALTESRNYFSAYHSTTTDLQRFAEIKADIASKSSNVALDKKDTSHEASELTASTCKRTRRLRRIPILESQIFCAPMQQEVVCPSEDKVKSDIKECQITTKKNKATPAKDKPKNEFWKPEDSNRRRKRDSEYAAKQSRVNIEELKIKYYQSIASRAIATYDEEQTENEADLRMVDLEESEFTDESVNSLQNSSSLSSTEVPSDSALSFELSSYETEIKVTYVDAIFEVLERFKLLGYLVFIYGGYARNNAIGTKEHDVDIITNCPIDQIKDILPGAFKYPKLNSFYYKYQNKSFDITSHSDLSVEGLQQFLRKSDLTINTFILDSVGTVYDLLGYINHLYAKKVYFIEKTEHCFYSHPEWILRAIKIATHLNKSFVPNDLKHMRNKASMLLLLPYGIYFSAMKGLFARGEALKNIRFMRKNKIYDKWLLQSASLDSAEYKEYIEKKINTIDNRSDTESEIDITYQVFALLLLPLLSLNKDNCDYAQVEELTTKFVEIYSNIAISEKENFVTFVASRICNYYEEFIATARIYSPTPSISPQFNVYVSEQIAPSHVLSVPLLKRRNSLG